LQGEIAMVIGKRLRGLRTLRNPVWAAMWAVELGLDRIDSPRHRNRTSENYKYVVNLFNALVSAARVPEEDVHCVLKELQVEGDALGSNVPQWAASTELVHLSYGLSRLLRPELVLETGIGSGASSRAILLGLEKNRIGHLHSIELPTPKSEMLPEIGYLVPQDLRHRWSQTFGASRRVMPALLDQLGKVDLFLHDSRHSYRNQRMEYFAVWPYLKPGGILLSDDVSNDAFLDAAELWKVTPMLVQQVGKEGPIGLLVKPNGLESKHN
jgi:predicted O-methyltransferase YrrM